MLRCVFSQAPHGGARDGAGRLPDLAAAATKIAEALRYHHGKFSQTDIEELGAALGDVQAAIAEQVERPAVER